jgi:hypothetical protein
MRQLRDHWNSKAYAQELIILIYDEPTERLLERCKHRYDLLKKVIPDIRVYGVVMNRRAWAESMLDQMDIIVANGDFVECRKLAQRHGKGFWIYSGVRDVHEARFEKGFLPWAVEAQGTYFWMYNYWFYNPDGCAVYMHPEEPNKIVRSTTWEGIREGMDDLRYLATAEKLLDRAPERGDINALRGRLRRLKESVDPRGGISPPRGAGLDESAKLDYYLKPARLRDEVIQIILDLP